MELKLDFEKNAPQKAAAKQEDVIASTGAAKQEDVIVSTGAAKQEDVIASTGAAKQEDVIASAGAAKQEDVIASTGAAKQVPAIVAEMDLRQVKRVPVLKCGTVMLQNFVEEYGEPGRQLMLIREPENEYDRWATKVCTLSGTMLGYLPAWKNQSVARLMDAGKTITVFVDEYSHIHEKGYFRRSKENPLLPLVIYLEIADPKER